MLRALSAELSEPNRYARAKAYARDGAVIDIDVRPGDVVGEVLGSRRDPYVVELLAERADVRGDVDVTKTSGVIALIPDRTELRVRCTCPDAGGGVMCKHAIAVLLVFADEVSIEPELLARWRGGDVSISATADGTDHTASPVDVFAPLLAAPSNLPAPPTLDALARADRPTPAAARTTHTDLLDALVAETLAIISRR